MYFPNFNTCSLECFAIEDKKRKEQLQMKPVKQQETLKRVQGDRLLCEQEK